jgi:pimeloyl-ACP methyl ester carboxylesterase
VAETSYLCLGALDQWVMFRGADVANPPLIILHGGPGLSVAPFFRHYNAPLERHFTVVHWDQRGTAKSFDPVIPRSSMTVDQFLSDLDELVDAVRVRLEQPKVAIFGHSWGSALGALYAGRFPHKVAAYVGCGQIGDWGESESLSYAYALAEAERRGNRRAVEELRAIGPPPHTAEQVWTQRIWLMRLEGELSARFLWRAGRVFIAGRESSFFDLPRFGRGMRFSMDAMWEEVTKLNLMKLVPVLRMPVFFFVGRRDHYVLPETSVSYFNALVAPSKELVWFEHSGHEPFLDEPDLFHAAMSNMVRPALAAQPRTETFGGLDDVGRSPHTTERESAVLALR